MRVAFGDKETRRVLSARISDLKSVLHNQRLRRAYIVAGYHCYTWQSIPRAGRRYRSQARWQVREIDACIAFNRAKLLETQAAFRALGFKRQKSRPRVKVDRR